MQVTYLEILPWRYTVKGRENKNEKQGKANTSLVTSVTKLATTPCGTL